MALVVVHELAVGGEHLVRDDERQVVGALGDRQAVLDLVAQQVHRGQSHVGVLGGVVDAVVVVPEHPGVLRVRVVVDLVLAGAGDVAGVAVVLRLGRRSVQVHGGPRLVAPLRVRGRQRVRHLDGDRPALARQDGGAGRDAVVAEDRGLDRRQDLREALFLGDVVERHVGDPVEALGGALRLGDRRYHERRHVRLGQQARRDPGGALRADRLLERQRDGRRAERRHLEHVPSRQAHRNHDRIPQGAVCYW